MTAESDYEKSRAERKEVGFPCDHDWKMYDPTNDGRHVTDICRKCDTIRGLPFRVPMTFEPESVCRRCRKPTEYQARWCYDCERAMFGDD